MIKRRDKDSVEKKDLLPEDSIRVDTTKLLRKIQKQDDLERIRRFVAYIYIHQ